MLVVDHSPVLPAVRQQAEAIGLDMLERGVVPTRLNLLSAALDRGLSETIAVQVVRVLLDEDCE